MPQLQMKTSPTVELLGWASLIKSTKSYGCPRHETPWGWLTSQRLKAKSLVAVREINGRKLCAHY